MSDGKEAKALGKRKRARSESDIDEPSAKAARVEGLDAPGSDQGTVYEWEPKGHSDFTIQCDGARFLVHKAVIARNSPAFKVLVFETAGSASVDLSGVSGPATRCLSHIRRRTGKHTKTDLLLLLNLLYAWAPNGSVANSASLRGSASTTPCRSVDRHNFRQIASLSHYWHVAELRERCDEVGHHEYM
jgi:hypothetical protein